MSEWFSFWRLSARYNAATTEAQACWLPPFLFNQINRLTIPDALNRGKPTPFDAPFFHSFPGPFLPRISLTFRGLG
jgi:hypothetical protein